MWELSWGAKRTLTASAESDGNPLNYSLTSKFKFTLWGYQVSTLDPACQLITGPRRFCIQSISTIAWFTLRLRKLLSKGTMGSNLTLHFLNCSAHVYASSAQAIVAASEIDMTFGVSFSSMHPRTKIYSILTLILV